jgi:23S rRNA pseudouridine1911/1915/1917 synthase
VGKNDHKMLTILWQDDDYLLLDKPAGVLTIPDRFDKNAPNLHALLRERFGTIFVVHRLDVGASGAICFAKNSQAHRALSLQFERHEVEKIYRALVRGQVEDDTGEIRLPIAAQKAGDGRMTVDKRRGKEAITRYAVLQRFRDYTLLSITLLTGKTHQVRVHCRAIGHPLAIDPLYGSLHPIFLSSFKPKYVAKRDEEEKPLISRLTLHAHSLAFAHFRSHARVRIEAPEPRDFRAAITQLTKWNYLT